MRLRIVVVLFLLTAGSALAEDRFLLLGSRAAAMGGAFTAVADDATAFYWNPAGIALGPIVSAGFFKGRDREAREGRRFEDRATGLSVQYTFMGVAFTKLREEVSGDGAPPPLELSDLAVSILQSLPLDNLVLGGNVHYLRASPSVEGAAKGSSWDVDLGLVYEHADRLRLGLMMRRLRRARFETPSGELRLSRHFRAGVSLPLAHRILVAADVDLSTQTAGDDTWREASFGVEKGFSDGRAFLRAGLRADLGSELGARPSVSFGGGVRVWSLLLEATYLGTRGMGHEAYWLGVTLAP